MIPARPTPWFRRLFAAHVRSRMRARFEAVRVVGLDRARERAAAGPLVVVSNHACWWDPLVALLVTEALRAEGLAMMDARNLPARPFLRLLGAFGVDLSSRTDGVAAIRYAARHLDRRGRLVWIFPQGRERPEDPRPLGFLGGAAAVARLAPGCRVLPVGIRVVFAGTERPELLIALGEVMDAGDARSQEQAVEAELDRLDGLLASGALETMETALRAPPDRVGGLAERLLGWMVGRLLKAGGDGTSG